MWYKIPLLLSPTIFYIKFYFCLFVALLTSNKNVLGHQLARRVVYGVIGHLLRTDCFGTVVIFCDFSNYLKSTSGCRKWTFYSSFFSSFQVLSACIHLQSKLCGRSLTFLAKSVGFRKILFFGQKNCKFVHLWTSQKRFKLLQTHYIPSIWDGQQFCTPVWGP